MSNIKPTLGDKPQSTLSKNYDINFKNSMNRNKVKLEEIDNQLDEGQKKLKKKIWNLGKMETLVFSDPKLSVLYDKMAEEGEYKYGYHYNETIMNILFNDYVLISSKYLQKYKNSIPSKKRRRDASGINKLKEKGEENMAKKSNSEIIDEPIQTNETTGAASSGAYAGPSAWGSGDLMKTKGIANVKKTPMVRGGTIIEENAKHNYLINPTDFENLVNQLNEQIEIENPAKSQMPNTRPYTDKKINNKIINDTSAFSSDTVKKWNKEDTMLQNKTITTGKIDDANTSTMEENLELNEKFASKAQQKYFYAKANDKSLSEKERSEWKKRAEEFSKNTKFDELPEKVNEESMLDDNQTTMAIKSTPVGTQSTNVPTGTNITESNLNGNKMLEELNNELNAFDILHKNLMNMMEDRKPSALVLKDRLGNENKSNFKKDLKDSSISKMVDVENSLEYNDQQSEIKNPYDLGEKIEKNAIKSGDMKSNEALKNVGDSDNYNGDEITKRNLTDDELDEVNKYRLGLGDYVYDNKPSKKFEERMKNDMGEKLYKEREEKRKFRSNAPMYNKDTQPTEKGDKKSLQFNKDKSGWNDGNGLDETFVTAKYYNLLGKKKIVNFRLNEAIEINKMKNNLFVLDLNGMGNIYTNKVNINENYNNEVNKYVFLTDGFDKFYKIKETALKINENKVFDGNEMNKMKHLFKYDSNTYVNTNNVKKNRGF